MLAFGAVPAGAGGTDLGGVREVENASVLLLSLRMRRILEFSLGLPPADLQPFSAVASVASAKPIFVCVDPLLACDGTAQAAAALLSWHRLPTCWVHWALSQGMPNMDALASSFSSLAAKPLGVSNFSSSTSTRLYATLLLRLHDRLLQQERCLLAGIEWSPCANPCGDLCLPQLRPTRLELQDCCAGSQREGESFGTTSTITPNALRPPGEGNSMPPAVWFGSSSGGGWQLPRRSDVGVGTALPIASKRNEILELVREGYLLLLQGETGCGKSTQVPQYILEEGIEEERNCKCRGVSSPRASLNRVRIVVTQPRRIAAITVARRVAEELGESCGEGVVGYKIRGATCAGPDCRLLFCTTGMLLRRLAMEGERWMFSPETVSHLIVDEVHERNCETDFLLTFLKRVIPKRPNLKIVLMSATMDANCFIRYFEGVTSAHTGRQLRQPRLLQVRGVVHPVYQVYLDDINRRLHAKRGSSVSSGVDNAEKPHSNNGSGSEVTGVCFQREPEEINYELIVRIVEEIDSSRDGAWAFVRVGAKAASSSENAAGYTGPPQSALEGSRYSAVLIFLPGVGEITQLQQMLSERSRSHCWWVLPLHGGLSTDEQQLCFQTQLPEPFRLKVVCATNIAETSITVPDIGTVIDTMRERRNLVDRGSNTPMLREQWCAVDSLTQRRGRAGRLRPGICLCLVPHSFVRRFEAVTPPEMQRVPLENVYLQVCASGIEDRMEFLASTPDPPDPASVRCAETALQDLGALESSASNGLSALGQHLAMLPCHPRLGKVLVLGCLLGVPGACLSIVAALSGRSPMLSPKDVVQRDEWNATRQELVRGIGCCSDHCALAALLHEWQFHGRWSQRDLCRYFGLAYDRMAAAAFERRHLCGVLIDMGLLPQDFTRREYYDWQVVPNWTLVRSAVSGGLYPSIIHATVNGHALSEKASLADRNRHMCYTVLQTRDRGGQVGPAFSFPRPICVYANSLLFGQTRLDCPWLACFSIQHRADHKSQLCAYDVSEATPYALLLFGNSPTYNMNAQELSVGGWARFKCSDGQRVLTLLEAARESFRRMLTRRIAEPRFDPSTSGELVAVVELLRTGGLGFEPTSPQFGLLAAPLPQIPSASSTCAVACKGAAVGRSAGSAACSAVSSGDGRACERAMSADCRTRATGIRSWKYGKIGDPGDARRARGTRLVQ